MKLRLQSFIGYVFKLNLTKMVGIFKIASNKNASLKCFDLEIKRKDRNATPQNFVGIDKTEQELLMSYFKSKAVKVQIVDDKLANKYDDYDDDDEMEDVSFQLKINKSVF